MAVGSGTVCVGVGSGIVSVGVGSGTIGVEVGLSPRVGTGVAVGLVLVAVHPPVLTRSMAMMMSALTIFVLMVKSPFLRVAILHDGYDPLIRDVVPAFVDMV